MIEADLVIDDAAELVTYRGKTPWRGPSSGGLVALEGGCLAAHRGRIVFVGSRRELQRSVRALPGAVRIDATGLTALPGWVDPHTHLVFAGSRADEFAERLTGVSYQEIARRGGGILRTVADTRSASEDDLIASATRRLDTFLLHGTTTVEAKSGYGLETAAELKQLRVARRLGASHPVAVVPTFLGAHTLPRERRDDREGYLREVVETMLPRVRAEALAEFVDVFCETGAFTVEESERVLRAGLAAGLRPRVHAEQFNALGAVELAVRIGAASADHLDAITASGIEALARSDTAAILLPTATYLTGETSFPPGAELVRAGAVVALATDCNPGTSMTESMPAAVSLACFRCGLDVDAALVAATLNAAFSLGRADRTGSLEPGKDADVALYAVPSRHHLVYHHGINHCRTVVRRGRVVVEGGRIVEGDGA